VRGGGKQYFTAAELAELRLPGLPKTKRKVNELALKERWAVASDDSGAPLALKRSGRGGGLEYHVSLLPAAARLELAKDGGIANDEGPAPGAEISADRAGSWAWFERQSASVKTEAERRLRAIERIDALEASGLTRTAAVACASAESGNGKSALWDWLQMVDGADRADRLPRLAPHRNGGGAIAEVDEEAWRVLLSDYLRPERPTWSSCYRRTVERYAKPRGIELPHSRTLFRKLEREIDPRLVVARREGKEALMRTVPPQKRSVAHLHAMHKVNIDGHRFDVFCRWPDGRVGRPIMVAIQDLYSRKFLGWRVGETESAVLTRLAFADVFQKYGIPGECYLDNGRAFASKLITGGAKSRFRFKIRDEEPSGLLTALGIRIHWTTPYSGQSKPIERAFRDLCDTIAKDPELAGAYTGNHIDAKPENYGSRAVPIEQFEQLVDRGMAEHNARLGRRTETANGQSFDQVFAASYATAPIGKATEAQLRLALLASEVLRADKSSGAVTLLGNTYWCEELSLHAGQKVTVRFDPDDLTLPVHVYDIDDRFLLTAPALEITEFDNAAAAQRRARQKRELVKQTRKLGEMERLLSAEQLAALASRYAAETDELPEPSVVRPVRPRRGNAAAAHAPVEQTGPAVIDRLAAAAANRLRLVQD
jgi:transposase InsO family protein